MREETRHTTLNNDAATSITVAHLLDPASQFDHPNEVLAAANLDRHEKRAILASWASDQYAVESVPALRHYPGTRSAVSYDEILQALKALDGRIEVSDGICTTKQQERRSFWTIARRRPRFPRRAT